MKVLGSLLLLTLLGNILTFPKPDKKKNNWKELAKDALCETKDSNGVMEVLKDYDDQSVWFVLVSSGKEGDTLRRPKRHSDKGKGWAADYKKGKLFDAHKCDLTMVVWRGKDLKMGDPGKCDTGKTSVLLREVISAGKGKKEDNDDVRKNLKNKSKKVGLSHFFFIVWSSGSWKWTSYGMSAEENECLVQNPNAFFLMNSGDDEDSSSSSEEDSEEDSSSEEDSDEDSSTEEDSEEDSSSEEDSDEHSSSEEISDEDPKSDSEEDSEDKDSSSEEDSDEDSSSEEDPDEDSSSGSEEDSDEDSSARNKKDSKEVSSSNSEEGESDEESMENLDADTDKVFGSNEDYDEGIVYSDSDAFYSDGVILQLRQSSIDEE